MVVEEEEEEVQMKPLEEDIDSIEALEEVAVGLQMLEEEVVVAAEEAFQLQDSIHIEPEVAAVAAVFVDFVFGNADTAVEKLFGIAFVDVAGTVECAVVGEAVDSGVLPAAVEVAAAADFAGKVGSHSSLPAVDAVHKQPAVVDLLADVVGPADAVGKD